MSPEQSQAIKSLQSVIWLNSLWRQDWIEIVLPGEWAEQCLDLITPGEITELQKLESSVACSRRPAGVMSSLGHYATLYYNIPESVFDYALITFVERQLCQTES